MRFIQTAIIISGCLCGVLHAKRNIREQLATNIVNVDDEHQDVISDEDVSGRMDDLHVRRVQHQWLNSIYSNNRYLNPGVYEHPIAAFNNMLIHNHNVYFHACEYASLCQALYDIRTGEHPLYNFDVDAYEDRAWRAYYDCIERDRRAHRALTYHAITLTGAFGFMAVLFFLGV